LHFLDNHLCGAPAGPRSAWNLLPAVVGITVVISAS
jgi:hypothetical protein